MKSGSGYTKFVKDIGWATAGTAMLTAGGFVLNVLLGNLFGKEGLGLYSLLITLYLATGTIAAAGLPGALTKYSTENAERPREGRRFFSAAILIAFVFGIFAGALLLICRGLAGKIFQNPGLASLLMIAAISLPLLGVNKMILARLRGLGLIRQFSIGESSRYVFLIILTLLFVLWRGNIIAAVWALVLTEFAVFVFLWRLVKPGRDFVGRGLCAPGRELLAFGSKILFSRLFVDLDARIGVLIAAYYLNAGDVGLFSVAFMFAQGLLLLPAALQKVTGPVVTQYFLAGDHAALTQLLNSTMQVTMFVLSFIGIFLVGMFPQLIKALYPGHDAFLDAHSAFNVLVAGYIFQGCIASIGSIFVSIGRPDIVLKISPVRLLVNMAVSVALVGAMGINGIAVGAAATSIVVFFLVTGLIRRVLKIKINYRPLFAIPALAGVSLGMAHVLSSLLPKWAGIIIGVIFFTMVAIKIWHFEGYIQRLRQQGEERKADGAWGT